MDININAFEIINIYKYFKLAFICKTNTIKDPELKIFWYF